MSKRGMTKRFLISEMDRSIKRMLKLIEEEGDSFAKKAEIYYQKRPVLVSHVEEFYRMFRSLAERYDNATSELKRLELRSQGSIDAYSEPPSAITSPDHHRLTRRLSGTRTIASFEMLGNREGYETSALDSGSDSDDSFFNSYSSASNYRRLRKKITELEAELRKVQMEHEENRSSEELAYYEEELRIAKEKIRSLEEEIGKLRKKLKKYELIGPRHDDCSDESVEDYANRIYSEEEKVVGSEEAIKRTTHELDSNGHLHYNQKGRESVDRVKREVPKRLPKQSSLPQEHISKLLKVRAFDDNIREWERCRSLEEDLRRIGIQKTEMEEEIEELKAEREVLVAKVSELEEETSIKDEQIDQINERLQRLHIECERSSKSIEELRSRSRELETCIEKQQKVIEEGDEEKRQAVRQLCISLEHYRNAYQMLRQDLLEHKKPVMAS